MLLEARDVTKAFGSFKAVDAASVTLEQGDILGLIGPNGAGKSTFFNCLTGDLTSTSGQVLFEGEDITALSPEARAGLGLARTFQVPQTFEGMSVLENVMIGAFLRTPHHAEAEAKARAVLQRVGMARLADTPARSLGTPGRKRLEIARALATEPKILLLDEAMAGLTQREVQLAIDLVRDIHRSGITDRKSTRLNSSHANISYAVFCLKKRYAQLREKRQTPHSGVKRVNHSFP